MVPRKNVKTAKKLIEKRIDEINFISNNKKSLINALVRSIESDEVVCITGKTGTGKDFLLQKIIISGLKEFRNLSILSELNITEDIFKKKGEVFRDVFNSLELMENFQRSKEVDCMPRKLIFLTNMALKDESYLKQDDEYLTSFYYKLTQGVMIVLPSIQELYLEYPVIISSIIKRKFNIPIEKILIGICGYIESLISGLNGNFHEIEKIIINDNYDIIESISRFRHENENIGVYQHFNSFLDKLPDRKKIWQSFWKEPNNVQLTDIYNFNKTFKVNSHEIIKMYSSGPFRKHPRVNSLIRLKYYCDSLLHHLNHKEINPHLWDPIEKKINRIISDQSTISSPFGKIFIFSSKKETTFKEWQGCQMISYQGVTYHLTYTQAKVLKYIFENFPDGREFKGKKACEDAGIEWPSLQPIFKSNMEAFKKLFKTVSRRKGIYKINGDIVREILNNT